MKEKISILVIVIIAALCLFGCAKDLPEDEMVSHGQSEAILAKNETSVTH